ncbi:hypothetical protein [Streptomyces sp. NBC_00648]|uniref:hypothetical protein n=1 Tax=Streptomyces sp. NBC_00648 TaxID=2975797 RepID=UPI003250E3E3
MTRDQALNEALNAATRAKTLAEHVESAAHSVDFRHKATALAAAGGLWTNVARSYAAIAKAAPETVDENPADGE